MRNAPILSGEDARYSPSRVTAAASAHPPLVIENARKSFKQGSSIVNALNGISLEVPQGRFVAIMGASGSGKSTLLHVMAGLTQADGGAVRVHGTEISKLDDRALTLFRRHHIGLVFQAFNLIPTLTAEENIRLPLMLDGKTPDEQIIGSLLDSLGLAGRRHHRPDALSGGEQQRVAIGRALITNPALILADEPTGNLDSHNSDVVCDLLRGLCVEQKRTIVMVTHEPSVAAYAQDVVVLREGRMVGQFETSDAPGELLAARYHELLRTGAAPAAQRT